LEYVRLTTECLNFVIQSKMAIFVGVQTDNIYRLVCMEEPPLNIPLNAANSQQVRQQNAGLLI
jgi:hypothetical protein